MLKFHNFHLQKHIRGKLKLNELHVHMSVKSTIKLGIFKAGPEHLHISSGHLCSQDSHGVVECTKPGGKVLALSIEATVCCLSSKFIIVT